jgi:hypothetical protein
MQRHRIVGRRFLVWTVMFGLVSPLMMTGCESHSESPVAQASAGQAAAKSSMDYMRKHVAEKKPASKGKAKGH